VFYFNGAAVLPDDYIIRHDKGSYNQAFVAAFKNNVRSIDPTLFK